MSAAGGQVKYNLLERGPESSGLLQRCADLDVTVVAHSPLSQGLLAGAAAGLLLLSSLQGAHVWMLQVKQMLVQTMLRACRSVFVPVHLFL